MRDDFEQPVSAEAPFRRIGGDTGRGLLLLCDHAENTVPAPYGSLGLPPAEMRRHIAYDIGAAALAEGLSARLGVPALLSRFSRLLIDPNRGLDDPTLVMRVSDGTVVPDNATIDDGEIAARIARYYRPYHAAIAAELDAVLAAGIVPVILSIHSFTEVMKGVPRPWHVTVLWDRDPRLPRPLLRRLAREKGLVVGNNEPYLGGLKGDTLYQHGTERGLAHALIEVRQDLIRDAAGQVAWADRLARVIDDVLAERGVMREARRIVYHGSFNDDPDLVHRRPSASAAE